LNAAALSPSPCLSPWAVPCLWQLLRLPQGGRHREGAQLAVEVTARVALAARPAAVHRVVHPEAARGAPGSGAAVHRVVHPEAARGAPVAGAPVHQGVHPPPAGAGPGSRAEVLLAVLRAAVHRGAPSSRALPGLVGPAAARLSAREDVPAPGVDPAAQEVAHPADLAA